MVWIRGGEFTMGTDDVRSFPNEHPAHWVRVEGFWLDEHDVTKAGFDWYRVDTFTQLANGLPRWPAFNTNL